MNHLSLQVYTINTFILTIVKGADFIKNLLKIVHSYYNYIENISKIVYSYCNYIEN